MRAGTGGARAAPRRKGGARRRGAGRDRQQPTATEVNLRLWAKQSDAYDRRFARVLGGRKAASWGLWRVPERELNLLGSVRGRDILEAGCGAARWSIALARRGARPVGLDFSSAQLRHARREVRRSHVHVPLLRATAEAMPFRDRTFDIVFSDWGALTFSDPAKSIPECARVLRDRGLLAFATLSPIRIVAHDRSADALTRRFLHDYFRVHRVDFRDEVNYTLPYGEWIRLFADNGLAVERLLELSPRGRRTPYLRPRESKWGERWPLESIWVARKRAHGK